MRRRGWILDASVDQEKQVFTLWIKEEGKTRGYTYDGFKPSLYVTTSLLEDSEWTDRNVIQMISRHQDVVSVEIVPRFASVYDDEPRRVLCVSTEIGTQREVARDLEKLPDSTVFHEEIEPVQQFFMDTDIFPFGRVDFEEKDGVVTEITCIDSRDDAEYDTPHLVEMGIEVVIDAEGLFPQFEDPIRYIEVYDQGRIIRIEEEDEREMLRQLQEAVERIDPDVIVTRGGDDHLFRYLSLRAKVNEVQLIFSRDGGALEVAQREPNSFWQYNQIVFKSGNQVMFNGRLHIDKKESLYYSPSGMEGVIEGCRMAFARPQKVARMSIGTANASAQFYTAHKMGILIPPVKRNPEFLKTVNDLATIDRGGLIFQPRPGIYENVAEVDFASMYPTLMVTRNISPETICTRKQCPYNYQYCIDIPELSFKICNRRRGIVSKSLEVVVRKRNEFKDLILRGDDTKKYKLKQNTLKGILVSCFGYLGFKNAKFGRVEAHTAVCAFARDVLLKTQEIGETMGLHTVHGIVDSLWISSDEPLDYEQLQEFCRRVSKAVDIEMSLKGVYKWMVIPSSRMHPSIAPLNRYYGVYRNGGIKTRGIETRRRDTCMYVGDCQKQMIEVLARGANKQEFIDLIPEAYSVCQSFIDRLFKGDVDMRDLVLHSRLTREPHEYRATSRAAVVAKQLVAVGKELHAGQKVKYVMVDSDASSPFRRVKALELLDESTPYDPQAYADLCIRAFENLIPAQHLDPSVQESERGFAVTKLV
ncbi:MAG: DNA polymerase domain-containing protein [Candidatus Thorarchaeota archaeon]